MLCYVPTQKVVLRLARTKLRHVYKRASLAKQVRGTQRLFSVKYLLGEAKIA